MMTRIKTQADESKEKLQNFLIQNEKLIGEMNKYEEKIKTIKLKENSLKNQLKEKENEMTKLKIEILALDTFRLEKEKIEKSNASLNKNLSSTKEDNEKKIKKIKDLEKQIVELKTKSDTLAVENKRLSESLESHKHTTGKFKDNKKIHSEEENKNLKEEIKKLKKENNDLTNLIQKEKADFDFPIKSMKENKVNLDDFSSSQPEISNNLELGDTDQLAGNGIYFN